MSKIQEHFIAAARGLVGTPWHDQERKPGLGLDCWGVIVCALEAVGLHAPDTDQGYKRLHRWKLLQPALEERFEALPPDWSYAQPGDVALWVFSDKIPHAAVVSAVGPHRPHIIHATYNDGKTFESALPDEGYGNLRSLWRLKPHELDRYQWHQNSSSQPYS